MTNEMTMELIKMLLCGDNNVQRAGTGNTEKEVNKGRYIVLGNRGNTVVGDLTIKGTTGYLSNASVIRRWGTTDGLGQLALKGPTESTKLDKCGKFEFELITSCGMIPVTSSL
jgi:hypothetical protein